MNDHQNVDIQSEGDSIADAIAAVSLIAIFMMTCIFWVSGQ